MINGEDRFSSIYPIADNHFILLGRTNPAQNVNNLLVAKIDIDGHFDTTFGTDGITQINFGGTNSIYPVKIFFQPNNNMMVVGLLIGGAGVAFAKLDTNGSLDTSFSVDGKSTTAIPVTGHEPIGNEGYPGIGFNNIELLPDNKYIITSTVRIINSYDYAIARLNENTTLDYSFMSNGVFVNNDATTFDWARGLHVQNDGKLVVVINSKLFRYMNFSVLSINDSSDDNIKLEVFPNPTNGFLNLGILANKVTITDLSNKTIEIYKNVEKIDFSNYAKGLYLINIKLENGKSIVKKILKE
jgi:uncharacterized delta-60 repeat protein